MKIQVYQTYEALSQKAAEIMLNTIQSKPNAVICLASGHSPKRACELFAELVNQKKTDVSNVHFVGLDEWVGVSADDPGSCQFFFRKNIIQPLSISESNCHLFDVSSKDLNNECTKMDRTIAGLGGIDLMVVGIGMNGHIGFNEPGVSFDLKSHVIELDALTQEVGQKYFSEKKILKQGITLGLSYMMESRQALLVANGIKKADIVSKALSEPVSNRVPASILQNHSNSLILLDEEAASSLSGNYEVVSRKS
jgi:glucosamine-6-phosphate isomerase